MTFGSTNQQINPIAAGKPWVNQNQNQKQKLLIVY